MNNTVIIDNKRSEWIDLVRVTAIILVVLCHSIEYSVYYFTPELVSLESIQTRLFSFGIFTISRLASCLFLLISGYLLLDRNYDKEKTIRFWKKSWLHLLICTLIWFLIYDLFMMIYFKKEISVFAIIADLIFFHNVEMMNSWYMPAVIGIYVLIPFVAVALSKFEVKMLIFPAIFYFIYTFGFPMTSTLNTIMGRAPLTTQLSLGFSGGVYCFYMICGYLVKKGAFKSVNTGWLILTIVCSIAAGTGIQIWAFSRNVEYTIWRDNPFVLFASLALFEAFSRIKITRNASFLKELASYSFAVYLVHVLVRHVIMWHILLLDISRPLKLLILWLSTLILSYILSWLISRIPKAGNYLIYRK